ncbi:MULTISPECIES: XkdX family protein [unclassified Bacillus cereus group]|uniref:XkdX family protein n=1 Tax=unclassified Bacillus cereus group TaxID=2750818 RepID=UPI00339789B3
MLTEDFWYKNIKRYYEMEIYKKEDVKKFWTPFKKITEEQYKEIVGNEDVLTEQQ